MNRKIKAAVNWCCCPIVAPLVLVIYAFRGIFAQRGGWAAYRDGLVKYLKGEL